MSTSKKLKLYASIPVYEQLLSDIEVRQFMNAQLTLFSFSVWWLAIFEALYLRFWTKFGNCLKKLEYSMPCFA